MKVPKIPKLILPSLNHEEVLILIDKSQSDRDKAIISLFVESGLRLSELTDIKPRDINWHNHTIKVKVKGGRECYAPFGDLTAQYLKL